MTPTTYQDAGVNIDAGEETVRRISSAVKSTYTSAVMNDIGAFGALFDARFTDFEHPVLVSSIDGVGTKLKVAVMAGRHDTVGQDLVNHCVDDILTTGAKPLFFLDYFSTGRLEPDVAEQIITGFTVACKQNGCSLIGGETAEMPGLYTPPDYDLAGAIVGVVEKSKILSPESVSAGDVLIGLRSTGLHTNGYSLARKVLFDTYKVDSYIEELGATVGDVLLAIHKSYYPSVHPLLGSGQVRAVSHITGGGIVGNTSRVLPDGLTLHIDWGSWDRPAIYSLIQKLGSVPEEDMRRTFNLGIGLILISDADEAPNLIEALKSNGEEPVIMGEIRSA
ncbi:MAG: phosphoribosylformylglycinamidine cyclo-ligase [Ectothiorhodospiraceae bacterium]|nr:phosphoribosylformylglycinamidine cyclo-ligase [Ectothiorhodospiraceae bacterium]